ncbi:hypothetical protein E1B28_000176 [Marasmius oreades]|uniref:Uncharacterized protein n=1 Tax=Marasmius oreades TaxID=181124 RepID=A0A9P7V0V2_9AGAR|nr:uncharacterized protein E1B28_000176 [Marasmius oreades]KAG7098208.1 hypothetical protein E1B28_000176 [Marasmius oreades]
MNEVQVHYDESRSHILSEKALKEGWDTFIFYRQLIAPGNLFVGLNTAGYGLKRSDVARWLSILATSIPSNPPDIFSCDIQPAGILQYLPTNMADKPVSWTTPANWTPGNYAFKYLRLDDDYLYNRPPKRVVDWLCDDDSETLTPKGIAHSFSITHKDSNLKTSLIYILPNAGWFIDGINDSSSEKATDRLKKTEPRSPYYGTYGWRSDPANAIMLPSALVDDFHLNNFGYDLEVNRFITFRGISPSSEALLQDCELKVTTPGNVDWAYIGRHFRVCLRVHCHYGDICAELGGWREIAARAEKWGSDGIPDSDRDVMDVAIRQWNLQTAAYLRLRYSEDSDSE